MLFHVAVHGAELHLPPEVDVHGALLHRGVDELVRGVSELKRRFGSRLWNGSKPQPKIPTVVTCVKNDFGMGIFLQVNTGLFVCKLLLMKKKKKGAIPLRQIPIHFFRN